MDILYTVALILVLVGALNWGLVSLFKFGFYSCSITCWWR